MVYGKLARVGAKKTEETARRVFENNNQITKARLATADGNGEGNGDDKVWP